MFLNRGKHLNFPATNLKNLFPGLTYVAGYSALHRLHPLVKLVLLVCFTLAVFTVPSIHGGLVLFVLLLFSYHLAGLGTGFFVRKLRFIFIFGFLILLVQILWVKEGYLIWQFGLGRWHFAVWSGGLWGGLGIVLRFVNVIGSSYLFVSTTDPNRLAYALMKAGLPYRAGFMLITAMRFIPLFRMELALVKNAQMAKGIELEGLSPRWLLRVVKHLLVPLVISALSKVDFLTMSMESRAFGLYPTRSYMYAQTMSFKDKLVLAGTPLVLLFFYFAFR
jgi:energy-coupling factor transport system permease protein